MLGELSKYQNLGTPAYYHELLIAFKDSPEEKWNLIKVRELFYNKIVDGRNVFDGCVPFLDFVGVIELQSNGEIIPEEGFFQFLVSSNLMTDKLVERLMLKLNDDSAFHSIFCSEFISYDIIYKVVQIDNAAFSFKYSKFKQLLLDLGVLKPHPVKELNKFILNSRFKKLFDKVVLPQIHKRKIGVDELKAEMEQRQIYGEEAEKFVLAYEEKRLNGTKEIDWVAEYSISDGYDIASYNTEESTVHDRFIEVKSYQGQPYFFWSRNEMDIARIKKSNYFLYLVNRSMMKEPEYDPLIIQDPYESVLNNGDKWEQRIEKIRFEVKPDEN